MKSKTMYIAMIIPLLSLIVYLIFFSGFFIDIQDMSQCEIEKDKLFNAIPDIFLFLEGESIDCLDEECREYFESEKEDIAKILKDLLEMPCYPK